MSFFFSFFIFSALSPEANKSVKGNPFLMK
uniref:Uncharacterized protein n=1 Tax=Rhizophora mucronata TaxID=61149 RepID=A0A2P2NV75_RHIMU